MLIKDVKSEPVCVQAEEILDTAARRPKKEDIGALPACQHDRVTKMITDRDITPARCRRWAQRRRDDRTRGDVCRDSFLLRRRHDRKSREDHAGEARAASFASLHASANHADAQTAVRNCHDSIDQHSKCVCANVMAS